MKLEIQLENLINVAVGGFANHWFHMKSLLVALQGPNVPLHPRGAGIGLKPTIRRKPFLLQTPVGRGAQRRVGVQAVIGRLTLTLPPRNFRASYPIGSEPMSL